MQGFFASSTIQQEKPIGLVPRCGACGLFKGCQSPKMEPYGRGGKRVLVVGESPGCISGDSLIDTAFRDKSKYPNGIPIRDLVGRRNFFVYSFDVEKQKLVIGKVKRVWKTGRKKVYRVTYRWRDWEHNPVSNSIKVTSNHPFLLKRYISHDPFWGWKEDVDYLSIDDGLRVGHSLQPFYRSQFDQRGYVGTSCKTRRIEAQFLAEFKEGISLRKKRVNVHHRDENTLNDRWKNLEVLSLADHWRHHSLKSNAMHDPNTREKHLRVMRSSSYRKNMSEKMRGVLSDPEMYAARLKQIKKQAPQISKTLKDKYQNDPTFYFNFLLGRQKYFGWGDVEVEERFRSRFPKEPIPINNHKITSIEYVGVEDVYDMEVDHFHNFAVNGIFVHNSTEDEEGRPFIGKAGQFLRDTLDDLGIDLDRDALTTNALICRPRDNKIQDPRQIDYCRPNLIKTIKGFGPRVIVTLGASALNSVLTPYWKDDLGTLERWVGWTIPLEQHWVCPTYHPSFLLRMKNPLLDKLFKKHLEKAFSIDDDPPLRPDLEKEVEIIYDDREAAAAIREMDHGLVAIDYETNCLKPEWPKAQIYSCALANKNRTISYPWVGQAIEATSELLQSEKSGKIASNLKMEERWTLKKLGHPVKHWRWCTMTAAHCLDNREGITSIKFQAFVKMGVPTYNANIEPYLKSGKHTPYNRIHHIDMKDLLLYGGTDSFLEREVAIIQMKEMGM